jgi:predicted Holliday junction resolvase-like endonuclease
MRETQLQMALVLALVVLAVLALMHVALRLRLSERVEAGVEAWRERELVRVQRQLAQAAEAEARAQLAEWQARSEGEIRRDAVARSKGVVAGKVVEHLAPYFDGFPYNPKDARFLGSPVDLVIFDGLDEGALREVVFVEVKTGASALTARERAIRDAIKAGRVRWEEYRPV